jgi:hypothetical protein
MSFNAALENLHAGIVTGDPAPAAPHLRAKPHLSAAAQIAIYSDAYRIRLRQAVRGDYPCLAAHLGGAIDDLIAAYVEATPSLSYNLDFYPFGFWRFVQNNSVPCEIGELAELEGAIAEVFMGPGSEVLTPQNLPPLDEEILGRTKFYLRAPYRLLRFTHDVESAMAAFKRGEAPSPVVKKPAYLFVHRHNNEVQRRISEENEYHLLKNIGLTENFNAAIGQMLAETGADEVAVAAQIARWLPRWIQEGFLATFVI